MHRGPLPLILSFSQWEKEPLNDARSAQHRSLFPSAFACECGHSKSQARQGELAGRDRARGNARFADHRLRVTAMRITAIAFLLLFSTLLPFAAKAQQGADKWVTAWAASAQGPYPVGNAILQPDLHRVFSSPETGAKDQSFRLIVGPDVWGREARIRLSNAFGTRPVTFDGVFIGLQLGSSAVATGTNRPVTFGGLPSVTVEPGQSVWSDATALPFAADAGLIGLQGRKLAVSFHVAGESGPVTWHAKGLTTSYLTAAGAGAHGAEEDEAGFPFSTTSWYFLDALDMKMAPDTQAIVAFGDSLTDGTGSTLNGDDRWPDVLSRRLHAKVWRQVRCGQCRHRRQSDNRPGGIHSATALPWRSGGAAAA